MSKKIILRDSPEAATLRNLPVWLSRIGRAFTDESAARYDGCTHQKCQNCENICEKRYVLCETCREKLKRDTFNAFPAFEWDEKAPICIFRSDQYFFHEDELEDYCLEHETIKEDLMLVLCEPVRPRILDAELFEDCLADDEELPKELAKAIEEFNAKVAEYPYPLSWIPCKKRIIFTKPE